jgi:RNA polymerase sigma-70 factor (ECF subfamily)
MSFALPDRHITEIDGKEMTMIDEKQESLYENDIVAAATAGDEAAFAMLARRYRRELHVHCYRMLASFEDAEDLVQETFLKAWQKRATFQGRATFRAWLYRIATNACLDLLARHERQVIEVPVHGAPQGEGVVAPHVAWLQPYPNRFLERPAPADTDPDVALVRKETIELAFVIAVQFLPPKQRAALILRDVLDWSANETAELLNSSVASVNGALQRARETLRQRQPERDSLTRSPERSEQDRQLLQQYIDATERCDANALAQLLRDDVRFSMPPEPMVFVGRTEVVDGWVSGGFGSPPYDDWKHVVTSANRMPAVAWYLRRPGDDCHRAFALDVVRIEHGAIAEITTFDLARLCDAFGIPETLA